MSSRRSAPSLTSGRREWHGALRRSAWASASPRGSTRPCVTPAPVRKELGIPTVFNFLGPLANPGRARYQVVGVSDRTMADKMLGVLEANGARRAWIVYGDDGLDELSTTEALRTRPRSSAPTRPDPGADAFNGSEGFDASTARPRDTECTHDVPCRSRQSSVFPGDHRRPSGGDAAYNAEVIRRVVAGDTSPHRDVAVLNAAASLVVVGKVDGPEGWGGAGNVRHRRR